MLLIKFTYKVTGLLSTGVENEVEGDSSVNDSPGYYHISAVYNMYM